MTTRDTSWMKPRTKVRLTKGYGLYNAGSFAFIDKLPNGEGLATIIPSLCSGDWQYVPADYLEPATS